MKQRTHNLINFARHIIVVASLVALTDTDAVEKPIGAFASSGASGTAIYANPHLKGVLVRASWSDIEPTPGVFAFEAIDQQVARVHEEGQSWSLGIIAGGLGTPDWVLDELHAGSFPYSFRGVPGYRLPLIWDSVVQTRLQSLAISLAAKYGQDPSLKLVYVPQMTSNGIEGHLQGVDMIGFTQAGYTDEQWVAASIANARNFALAFENKALAFEVHDINGGIDVPMSIVDALWNDEELEERVGAAVWWLSGKTSYQPELLEALAEFPGDIYGQFIANSSQTGRFADDKIENAFSQAKALGMRYLEAWEYDLKYVPLSAQGAWDHLFADYNAWAASTYGTPSLPLPLQIEVGETHLAISHPDLDENDQIWHSFDLRQWQPIDDIQFQDSQPPSFLIERASSTDSGPHFFRLGPVESQ